MNLNELAAELKEVALKLNQVKHYVTKENLPIEDGMSPILALMQDHARLDLRVRNLTTALTKVSEHNERMGHDIKEMAALLADINEYCQQNNIGTIGDSSSKALMASHTNLQEQLKASQQDYWRAVGNGTPLGGCAVKDPSKCRIETDGECGCAFGQCANGLVF